jgi:bifunctional UDP-N-acetylglucosamine pyrophosphorylase/glucosamine-1-phosphate N-acetyltransferase
MAEGATLLDPDSVWFSFDTALGRDVTVGPNVFFGPGVAVADNVKIHSFSHLDGVTVQESAVVGPFARLRPGAVIGRDAHVGNFVEIKNAVLGEGAKANHLSYIGDAEVGAQTNIGAGTITCNYDGYMKHRTVIGKSVFIGSNTAIVAPVTIGDGAVVGAGSTVVRDVPADSLTVARGEQVDRPGRASALREKLAQQKRAQKKETD